MKLRKNAGKFKHKLLCLRREEETVKAARKTIIFMKWGNIISSCILKHEPAQYLGSGSHHGLQCFKPRHTCTCYWATAANVDLYQPCSSDYCGSPSADKLACRVGNGQGGGRLRTGALGGTSEQMGQLLTTKLP